MRPARTFSIFSCSFRWPAYRPERETFVVNLFRLYISKIVPCFLDDSAAIKIERGHACTFGSRRRAFVCNRSGHRNAIGPTVARQVGNVLPIYIRYTMGHSRDIADDSSISPRRIFARSTSGSAFSFHGLLLFAPISFGGLWRGSGPHRSTWACRPLQYFSAVLPAITL